MREGERERGSQIYGTETLLHCREQKRTCVREDWWTNAAAFCNTEESSRESRTERVLDRVGERPGERAGERAGERPRERAGERQSRRKTSIKTRRDRKSVV